MEYDIGGKALPRITIDYDGLDVDDSAYVAILQSQEAAVRNGVSALCRTESVRWRCDLVENHQLVFRLVSGVCPETCFGRFLPLDFTLSTDDFTKLIIECRRSEG